MTNTLSASRPALSRQAYLFHCIRISLSRRLVWLGMAGVAGLGLAFALQLPATVLVLAPFVLVLLSAAVIALQSWQRHSQDFEARRA